MFEIVKRQHIRQAGPLGPAHQPWPAAMGAGYAWQAKTSLDESPKTGLSFLIMSGFCRADIDHESNQVS